MADTIYTNPALRHDFVLLFDVTDGNPNGDPDAGNLPRLDPETMQGLVTDVCLKRKVRDWVGTNHQGNGYEIYVQHRGLALNDQHQRAYNAKGLKSTGAKQDRKTVDTARDWMCQTFYDVRMFGAVMSTGVNCGQVRGPAQLTFARSVDPITPLDLSITRVAVTKSEDLTRAAKSKASAAATEDAGEMVGKETEMGRKAIVPYGLYRGHGFFTPAFAERTGASAKDLELFWQALQQMWDQDHSAARGQMSCRGLYLFTHSSKLGNAPAHVLFDRIAVERRAGVDVPRKFADYTVTVSDQGLPEGVILTRLVG